MRKNSHEWATLQGENLFDEFPPTERRWTLAISLALNVVLAATLAVCHFGLFD